MAFPRFSSVEKRKLRRIAQRAIKRARGAYHEKEGDEGMGLTRAERDNAQMREQIANTVALIGSYESLRLIALYASQLWLDESTTVPVQGKDAD